MKSIMMVSWGLSIFLAWGISQNYQLSELTFSLNLSLIIAAFLVVILYPIYWIFAFSEKLERSEKGIEEETRAEVFTESVISQKNLDNTPPLILKKSEAEIAQIFSNLERLTVESATKEEIRSIKKQTQIKILSFLNNQTFEIDKLQEEMLMIVEISGYLNDAEKMMLCHKIKQYISQKYNHLVH